MNYKYPLCVHDHLCESTGGICPIVGCPKELVNGPCGGVREGGKCEVIEDLDCVWVKIYDQMKKNNELDKMLVIQEARNTNFYASLVKSKKETS
jgi:hypothetical protein